MSIPIVDTVLGMTQYATKEGGVGGAIKRSVDDFVVEEVLVDGSKASVSAEAPAKAIGSSQNRQRYLLCIMVKRNWDTFIATKNVAKSLGIEPKAVQFAGIKDAKAVTAQYITLENTSPEEAAKIDFTDLKLVPVGYMREVLSLFYLLGNNFTITLRNPEASESALKERIEATVAQLTDKAAQMQEFQKKAIAEKDTRERLKSYGGKAGQEVLDLVTSWEKLF